LAFDRSFYILTRALQAMLHGKPQQENCSAQRPA
jgi:hypothetical protein